MRGPPLKRRASAFAGTDLEPVLRARAVDAIAVAGVATSAMVAAPCYDAADRDYRITALRDGCADAGPAVHDFFMDKVFPGRGLDVASVRELVRAARRGRMRPVSSRV